MTVMVFLSRADASPLSRASGGPDYWNVEARAIEGCQRVGAHTGAAGGAPGAPGPGPYGGAGAAAGRGGDGPVRREPLGTHGRRGAGARAGRRGVARRARPRPLARDR